MLKNKLLAATGNSEEPLYSDSVFSAYTYTGNGATQTITNGIDLAGKGGLVWCKSRDSVSNHGIFDTLRGVSNCLYSQSANPQAYSVNTEVNQFNSNGFQLGATYSASLNTNAEKYVSWTFRRSPKFFDVVTYTGTGVNRTIAHALGQEVGLILVKRTDTTAAWQAYHRGLANTEYMVLNSTAAKATGATRWNSTTPTTSVFSVGTDATVNASGGTYVAYLFAHDASADGIVQCGSYVGTGASNDINLGWEPQFVMVKSVSGSFPTNSWVMMDASRPFPASYVASATGNKLYANESAAEGVGNGYIMPRATGFNIPIGPNELNAASTTYIYLAIRRPNKPPTVGTQVYNAIARTGTGAAATVTGVGFAPDLVALHSRSGTTGGRWEDRLRGATIELVPETTAAETTVAQSITSFGMDGFALGTDGDWNTNTATYIHHCFKRAPGVFDQVCYTGTGVAKTEAHNLGVVPELMIVKSRSGVQNWGAYTSATGAGNYLSLNQTLASTASSTMWNNTAPTSLVFSVGVNGISNTSAETHVAYLFATKAGISKVGSYTGNGTTNAINCGFTTGARFVLIKRTDSTGDWYVWDTVRGIIAGNDPYLLLNSTAAEVTSTDYIDPVSTGFELSSTAPAAINASGGSFIFLAFA